MSLHPGGANRPVAIVTGGTRGIGRSVVEVLCRDGFAVVFTHSNSDADARDAEKWGRLRGYSLRAVRLDVTDDHAPQTLLDRAESFGQVAALVNNAGITGSIGAFTDLTDEDLRRVMEVNLVAPTRLCREIIRRWTSDESIGPSASGRSIANISSIAARTGSPGEYVAYAAAKAGVEALTTGLAREFGPVGIRVNAVSPGTTDTTIHARAGEPGRAQRVGASVPLGRPGNPVEIAEAVTWLLSPRASYVTGAVLNVSGGL
ncbi:MAG: SDR family NAD(P)-dependent oxidoreductase [Actinomycetota bacterium]